MVSKQFFADLAELQPDAEPGGFSCGDWIVERAGDFFRRRGYNETRSSDNLPGGASHDHQQGGKQGDSIQSLLIYRSLLQEPLAEQLGIGMPRPELREKALQWERWYHGRSGRTARQFINSLLGSMDRGGI